MSHEYEGVRRIVYGAMGSEYEGATFVPVCEKCGRFVKADKAVTLDGNGRPAKPNATCSQCGIIQMLFEGYI